MPRCRVNKSGLRSVRLDPLLSLSPCEQPSQSALSTQHSLPLTRGLWTARRGGWAFFFSLSLSLDRSETDEAIGQDLVDRGEDDFLDYTGSGQVACVRAARWREKLTSAARSSSLAGCRTVILLWARQDVVCFRQGAENVRNTLDQWRAVYSNITTQPLQATSLKDKFTPQKIKKWKFTHYPLTTQPTGFMCSRSGRSYFTHEGTLDLPVFRMIQIHQIIRNAAFTGKEGYNMFTRKKPQLADAFSSKCKNRPCSAKNENSDIICSLRWKGGWGFIVLQHLPNNWQVLKYNRKDIIKGPHTTCSG